MVSRYVSLTEEIGLVAIEFLILHHVTAPTHPLEIYILWLSAVHSITNVSASLAIWWLRIELRRVCGGRRGMAQCRGGTAPTTGSWLRYSVEKHKERIGSS